MTREPRIAAFAVVILLVAAAIVFALQSAPVDAPPVETPRPAASGAHEPPATPVAAPRNTTPAPTPNAPARVDPAAAPAEPTAPAAPPPVDERCPLAGTFVVTDQDGVVHDALDGEFVFVLFFADVVDRVPVRVAAGRFELIAPRAPRGFAVEHARLGDRDVRCKERRAFRIGDRLALRGTWPPRLRLNVLDARSGNHLDGVEVVASDALRAKNAASRHPADEARVVVRDAQSPVDLAPPRSSNPMLWLVRAAGHSWNSLVIDGDDATERTIRLGLGGDLEVHVTGAAPPNTRVAAYRVIRPPEPAPEPTIDPEQLAATTPLADLALATDGPTRFVGLDAGTVAVRIVAGTARRGPTLGFTTTSIANGGRSVVTIALQPVEVPPAVPIAGTLELSTSWPAPTHLVLHGTGAAALAAYSYLVPLPDVAPDDRTIVRRIRWDAGELPAGRYEFALDELAFRTTRTIDPPGDRQLVIAVPEPANVAIRVLDTNGGNAFATTHDVLLRVEAWGDGSPLEVDGVTGPDHVHRVTVAPGQLTVHATVGGELTAATRVDVRSGPNEITLQPRVESGFFLVLKEGGTEIPFPDDLELDLVDENGVSVLSTRLGNRIAAKVPGHHMLRIGEVPGYLPRHISGWVRAGEWYTLTTQLERKR